MVGYPPRESPAGSTECAGNGGHTLDPQRQHAQLLGLWSQGSKLIRRLGHRGYGASFDLDRVERWWNVARRLSERGLAVQILPLEPPVVLVAWGKGKESWLTLVDATGIEAEDPTLYHRLLMVHFDEQAPALSFSGEGPRVAARTLLRLSERTLRTLIRIGEESAQRVSVADLNDALVVLAAWQQEPRMMERAPGSDWIWLARLWRHRGSYLRAPADLVDRYPELLVCDAQGRIGWRSPKPDPG
jgi:hypothetical protein